MKDYKIRLGYVPVMRDTFPAGPAEVMRDKIRERVEEIVSGGRIYRPAFKQVEELKEYIPLNKRKE